MPNENMTCISDDTRKKLDEFIEKNYPRLLARVRYREKDESKAEAILHDIIVKLYTGKRSLNFDGYPLRHFEYLVQNAISATLENRQNAFEDGYRVEVRRNVIKRVPIRNGIDTIPIAKLTLAPSILQDIERHEQYVQYLAYKATLPLIHQHILTHLEAGFTIDMVHKVLAEQGICHTRRWVLDRTKVLIRQVERVMRSVHFPVD